MVWSRGGDVVAVNPWQNRFGIVLIVVLGSNQHENDPEAGSPNTHAISAKRTEPEIASSDFP